VSLVGRVKRISNVKKFVKQKGKRRKIGQYIIADDTGEMRVVMWTENIKLLKKIPGRRRDKGKGC